ncbi:hypothetical protein MPL3356_590003 [Mesorhizobium plurifarium]|uniref:Uncharacterized protein n=1 Tax=Mesorhizobium plurifarium TaxID=69974 RepID=A0A090ECU5_MESPL|nr:hypothetical protein MPL3356_590003 [Mesorhizobium plurifarium]
MLHRSTLRRKGLGSRTLSLCFDSYHSLQIATLLEDCMHQSTGSQIC